MSLSQSHNALGGRDWPRRLDVRHWAYRRLGPSLWTFKERHCCEIWGEQRRDFRVLGALSGFCERAREIENKWRKESERKRTDGRDKAERGSEQTDTSARRASLCIAVIPSLFMWKHVRIIFKITSSRFSFSQDEISTFILSSRTSRRVNFVNWEGFWWLLSIAQFFLTFQPPEGWILMILWSPECWSRAPPPSKIISFSCSVQLWWILTHEFVPSWLQTAPLQRRCELIVPLASRLTS